MSNGTWNGSKWIRPEKRLAIHLRDNLCCLYCGSSVEDAAALTLDHLKPRSKGGSNCASNLISACKKCNSSRGTRPVMVFCRAVGKYIGKNPNVIYRNIQLARKRSLPLAEAKAIIRARSLD